MHKNGPKVPEPEQLTGWKEISAYIGKGVRQAQRWEKLGMPVHRVGGMDGVVYAFRIEIDQWRRSAEGRQVEGTSPESSTPARPWHRRPSQRLRRALGYSAALIGLALLGLAAYRLQVGPPLQIVLWSEADAMQGASFRFRATGNAPDLHAASRRMWEPNGREHLLAPAVNRDRDGQFVWVFSTDCQTMPGRHRVALADSTGKSLTETLEIEVRPNPQCQGAVPDIIAEAVSVDSDIVETGGDFTCRFVLRNQGAHITNPSTTRLRLSQSPIRSSISDIRLGDVTAPALKPGESASFEFRVTLPTTTPLGVYYVWIVADNNSDNIESFSHNNYARSAALVVSRAVK